MLIDSAKQSLAGSRQALPLVARCRNGQGIVCVSMPGNVCACRTVASSTEALLETAPLTP
ncbi:hypothetical protein [Xanthomonas euvesicatoria]|uniref:hypothetical protein n=1 Tax=Xanthomonas euvesicatoria TaxID=456327 RepID=UPI002404A4C3|nr:hypothetical protein [Xanthomonas euvesicatoria]MCP3036570.1 hypothetical protein [Xanthomonas euvesicatoria pv. allii]